MKKPTLDQAGTVAMGTVAASGIADLAGAIGVKANTLLAALGFLGMLITWARGRWEKGKTDAK